MFFLTIPAIVSGACPEDDTYINSDTVLSGEFCEINDSGKKGVLILNSSDIILDCNGTTLKGNGSGFGINIPCDMYLKNITVKNCKLIDYLYGIELCTTRKNKIFNNYFSNISNVGIALAHNASENEIHNNIIEFSIGGGIRIYEGEYNRIYKNKIRSCITGICIIDDGEGYCDGNIITENFISEGYNGIFYRGCGYGVISNNTITNSTQYGIFFNALKEINKISNNRFMSNKMEDIHFEDSDEIPITPREITGRAVPGRTENWLIIIAGMLILIVLAFVIKFGFSKSKTKQ